MSLEQPEHPFRYSRTTKPEKGTSSARSYNNRVRRYLREEYERWKDLHDIVTNEDVAAYLHRYLGDNVSDVHCFARWFAFHEAGSLFFRHREAHRLYARYDDVIKERFTPIMFDKFLRQRITIYTGDNDIWDSLNYLQEQLDDIKAATRAEKDRLHREKQRQWESSDEGQLAIAKAKEQAAEVERRKKEELDAQGRIARLEREWRAAEEAAEREEREDEAERQHTQELEHLERVCDEAVERLEAARRERDQQAEQQERIERPTVSGAAKRQLLALYAEHVEYVRENLPMAEFRQSLEEPLATTHHSSQIESNRATIADALLKASARGKLRNHFLKHQDIIKETYDAALFENDLASLLHDPDPLPDFLEAAESLAATIKAMADRLRPAYDARLEEQERRNAAERDRLAQEELEAAARAKEEEVRAAIAREVHAFAGGADITAEEIDQEINLRMTRWQRAQLRGEHGI